MCFENRFDFIFTKIKTYQRNRAKSLEMSMLNKKQINSLTDFGFGFGIGIDVHASSRWAFMMLTSKNKKNKI